MQPRGLYNTLQTTFYITGISLKKYGYHIINIGNTALILHRHIDPTLVNICAGTKTAATITSHVIAI